MPSGYGPDCPKCGQSAEWTNSEIEDPVYAPRTYFCNFCYHMYILDVDEIAMLQSLAKDLLAQCDGGQASETEEDWQRARQEWDKPSEE